MKVKDFKNLKVGDKVRITDKKYGEFWNDNGLMDHWLGKVMTVREILTPRVVHGKDVVRVKMKEDTEECGGGGWFWQAEMIAEKIEPVKEVKRKAKVGEYIKIVDPKVTYGHYKKGDILEVHGVYKNGGVDVWGTDGADVYVLYKEYVVLENYIPEEKPFKEVKRKAKVGEWIKVVDAYLTSGLYKNGYILKVGNNDVPDLRPDAVRCELPGADRLYTVLDREYVVLENYKPEDKKPESKEADEMYKQYHESCIDAFRKVCSKAWKDAHPTIVEHLVKDRKTIVKLSNGKVGVAVCSPDDKFDIYEGLRLATERAYGKTEPYKKPEAVKEVNREAKVGEYIKIVKANPFLADYKNGQIFKVIGDSAASNVVLVSNTEAKATSVMYKYRYPIISDEYVVLENYKPKK